MPVVVIIVFATKLYLNYLFLQIKPDSVFLNAAENVNIIVIICQTKCILWYNRYKRLAWLTVFSRIKQQHLNW